MKILHINTERTWRGGERQTFWLARELERRGHQNAVVCRSRSPLAQVCREEGLTVFSVSPLMEADPWAALKLRWAMIRWRADMVHAHTAHAVTLGALGVLGTKVPFVATRRVDFRLKTGVLNRLKYGRITRLVAISDAVRQAAAAGYSRGSIPVIPSGIDPMGYPTPDSREAFRRERGYGLDEKLIVAVGALVPHKDHRTLIEAMSLVLKEVPGARLMLIGEGPLYDVLVKSVVEKKLQDAVFFLGRRSDVLEHIALADVFAMPSAEEGLGTVLLDAMAVGVPISATRAGGIPEVFDDQGSKRLTPVGDAVALARDLVNVMKDPNEAQRRVAEGKRRVGDFSVQTMAERYEKLYQRVASSE